MINIVVSIISKKMCTNNLKPFNFHILSVGEGVWGGGNRINNFFPCYAPNVLQER